MSKEFTPFTGSFKWGVHLPLVSMCALVSIYSYKLTVSNGEGGHLPLVSICALVSIYSYKLTVSNHWQRGSFAFGIYMYTGLYIFL